MKEQKPKEGKPSWGAEFSALYRACESLRPENERVCYDPVAKHFLGPMLAMINRSPLLIKIGQWWTEWLIPGNTGYVVARTQYIDDYLKTCLHDGIEQLVILGAGYDSRAYRFQESIGKVKVFEIDHPATQRVKIKKVEKTFGSLPKHCVYVPVDFDRDRLDARMVESGYAPSLKTLFIWEGVTMFITAEGVDATLSFMAQRSGPSSSIIFDYILKSVVDGTCEFEEAEKWRRVCKNILGEPYTFGIEAGIIGEFLSTRGFHQVGDIGADFLKSTYFKAVDQHREMPRHYRVVHATVKPS